MDHEVARSDLVFHYVVVVTSNSQMLEVKMRRHVVSRNSPHLGPASQNGVHVDTRNARLNKEKGKSTSDTS
ncbi:hypothetical protein ANO14919_028170 [Xylariales sp. No.14919]|nr:hypothetical protein ANO14919_028170 [Xylariales sp. No.14919]